MCHKYSYLGNNVSRIIARSEVSRSRSHRSFEFFAVSNPWPVCSVTLCLVDRFNPYMRKYNPWGGDVPCSISRSIDRRSRSRGSFELLQYSLHGSKLILSNHFIRGTNYTHDRKICRTPLADQKIKSQDRSSKLLPCPLLGFVPIWFTCFICVTNTTYV